MSSRRGAARIPGEAENYCPVDNLAGVITPCYFWCMNTKSHTGLPSVAHMCGRVVVLCPQKHVVSAHKPEDWAHSSAEANMHLPVTCQGSN